MKLTLYFFASRRLILELNWMMLLLLHNETIQKLCDSIMKQLKAVFTRILLDLRFRCAACFSNGSIHRTAGAGQAFKLDSCCSIFRLIQSVAVSYSASQCRVGYGADGWRTSIVCMTKLCLYKVYYFHVSREPSLLHAHVRARYISPVSGIQSGYYATA